MNRTSRLSIQAVLLMSFLLVAFIPMISVGISSYLKSEQVIETTSNRYHEVILRETSKRISFKLDEIEKISQMLFSDPEIQEVLRREAKGGYVDEFGRLSDTILIEKRLLSSVMAGPDILAASILSRDGTVYSADYYEGDLSPPLSPSQVLAVHAARGAPVWLETDAELCAIPLARVVNDLDTVEPLGILVLFVREQSVFELYRELVSDIDRALSGSLFIVNDSGKIVSHITKGLLAKEITDPAFDKVFSPDDLLTYLYEEEGSSGRYVSYKTIDRTGWRIIAEIPEREYKKDIVSIRTRVIYAALLLLFASVLISVLLARVISRPLKELMVKMNSVRRGDFEITLQHKGTSEMVVLTRHFERMIREIDQLIKTVYQEEIHLKRAELESLIMQINPHFLYNTLESINWVARKNGVEQISEMVKALGDLMRVTIQGEKFLTLDQELANIENYLRIQEFRHGERLSYAVEIDDQLRDTNVPKLILQPIVENAIKHGIEPSERVGRISIHSQVISEDAFLLIVSDNGVGFDSKGVREPQDSDGIGLANVHKRIQMTYGKNFGIELTSVKNYGTTVLVRLPYRR